MIDEQIDTSVRRDRYGRYEVVPPGGSKPVGYTRATTIAKTLDDQGGLMAWGKRMVGIGLTQRPDLLTELSITDTDDKKALDRICEKAAEAGGATVRRELGTALHSIFERHWTDTTFTVPPAHAADVQAVETALASAGLRVVNGFHERMVVDDAHKIAGTFDLLVTDGHVNFVADLKTGSSVKYGSLGFAVQLAIYANADNLYTQGAAVDGSDDTRDPMPLVSVQRGLIIHVQPGSGSCDLHWVDLEAGYKALEIALQVRELRKANHLRPVDTDTDIAETTAAIVKAFPNSIVMCPTDIYEWLRSRVVAIVDAGHQQLMAAHWPDGVPTFRSGEPLTNTQALELEAAISEVERTAGVSFPDPKPGVDTPTPKPAAPKRRPKPTEGVHLDRGSAVLVALDERHRSKPEAQRAWLTALLNDCHAAGRSVHMRPPHGEPTERRFHIIAGLVAISDCISNDLVARLCELVVTDYDPDLSLAVTLGSLTVSEAIEFHKLCEAIDATELDVTFGETVVITGDINAVLAA